MQIGKGGIEGIMTRQPGTPVYFVGWICGNKNDRRRLVELGVEGDMKWKRVDNSKRDLMSLAARGKVGVFEQCIITFDVAKKLKANYPAFDPTTFTAFNDKDEQTIDQPFWEGRL